MQSRIVLLRVLRKGRIKKTTGCFELPLLYTEREEADINPSRHQWYHQALQDNLASGSSRMRQDHLASGSSRMRQDHLALSPSWEARPDAKGPGRVTYNGHSFHSLFFILCEIGNNHAMNEFVPQRTSAYIGQHDLPVGEMMVRELGLLGTMPWSQNLLRVVGNGEGSKH